MTKDYYKILGVAEFDSAENIKIAYRKLARKWHPDVAGDSEEAILRFKEINEAYETLSNQSKKSEYDKARKFYNYAKQTSSYNSQPKSEQNSTDPQKAKKGFNFNWEEFLGKKYRENAFKEEKIKAPKRGEDVYSDIEISFLESVSGVTKTVNMLQTHVCSKCKGKKFVNGAICSECSGKGDFTEYKKFTVNLLKANENKVKIK